MCWVALLASLAALQDLVMMFEWLDVDQNGEIEFDEMLHGSASLW